MLLPPVPVIEHLCATALTRAERATFDRLTKPLTPAHRAALDFAARPAPAPSRILPNSRLSTLLRESARIESSGVISVFIELFVPGLGAEHVGCLIQTRSVGVQGIGRETCIGAGVRPTLLLEGLGDTR